MQRLRSCLSPDKQNCEDSLVELMLADDCDALIRDSLMKLKIS